jgi:16S rRNA (guanine527-N7)-methyltransferase
MQLEDSLNHYNDLLIKWQKTINLISPSTLDNIWNRHFNDSLQIADYIPSNTKILCDIGSGAGFPGLVIALAKPQIDVHLIESDTRKCAFLNTVSRETSCNNVTIHNKRIEDIIGSIKADCLTSRALASLRQLIRYAEPQWRNNPQFYMVLPKGSNHDEEIEEALRYFSFNVQCHQSITNERAAILVVNNITSL